MRASPNRLRRGEGVTSTEHFRAFAPRAVLEMIPVHMLGIAATGNERSFRFLKGVLPTHGIWAPSGLSMSVTEAAHEEILEHRV